MDQALINIIIGACGLMAGFLLHSFSNRLEKMQDRLAAIETLVAGKYMPRDELGKNLDSIFSLLRALDLKLDDKLASKVDRDDCDFCREKGQ